MRRIWRRPATLAMMLGASILVGWAGLSAPALAQTGATPSAAEASLGNSSIWTAASTVMAKVVTARASPRAVVYPKPRDFTSGIYKFRTHHETVNGNKMPGDEDIFRSINDGLHGTSMPGWSGFYNKQQIGQLVRTLRLLPRFLRKTKPGQPWISAGRFLPHRPVLRRAKNILKRPLNVTPAMA